MLYLTYFSVAYLLSLLGHSSRVPLVWDYSKLFTYFKSNRREGIEDKIKLKWEKREQQVSMLNVQHYRDLRVELLRNLFSKNWNWLEPNEILNLIFFESEWKASREVSRLSVSNCGPIGCLFKFINFLLNYFRCRHRNQNICWRILISEVNCQIYEKSLRCFNRWSYI